jgi:hypothetical protein
MHRAGRIGRVREGGGIGQLERLGGHAAAGGHGDAGDAGVGRRRGQAGRAGREVRIVARRQTGFGLLGQRHGGQALRKLPAGFRSAGQRRRHQVIGERLRGRAQQEHIPHILRLQLLPQLVVGALDRVLVGIQRDDAFGEQVADGLPGRGRIGGKHVIEAAVLADDDDDVLDRRFREVVARGRPLPDEARSRPSLSERRGERELCQCQYT